MLTRRIIWRAALAFALSALLPGGAPETRAAGSAESPGQIAFHPALLARLTLPAGFRIEALAQGMNGARMMAVADDGTLYVTRPDAGDVVALRPDASGRPTRRMTALSGLPTVHGIALHAGQVYLATSSRVLVAELQPDGKLGKPRQLIGGLPRGGHDRHTIGFGPDGMLYVSIGSTCNVCQESDHRHAAILRARADGTGITVFARGLRNTMGFAWHPETGELWGMDHGSDWRGNDRPGEELNRLVTGGHYGWPYCWEDKKVDEFTEFEPQGATKTSFCAQSRGSALAFQAHSAPIGMTFYAGSMFPEDYQGDAFVAFHGSWNRSPAAPSKVARVRFRDGKPQQFEDFISGFQLANKRVRFGRPAGLAVAKDGALIVGDDLNGVIYRVWYAGS